MSFAQSIGADLPYLRRYARALTGSQAHGDAFVRAALEAIVADPATLKQSDDMRVDLYHVFHRIWESAHVDVEDGEAGGDMFERAVQARLSQITPLSRQALLLNALEGFPVSAVARIIGIDTAAAHKLIDQAIAEIDRETATDVLVIEDEPLIAMQLEELVQSLGHRICGSATTHAEAMEAVERHQPGLVLADIQLADGSSGIDAVKDILSRFSVPVIFITAFPERLLTGERPEPTYLITKPFQENTVRAAISQAMFLGTTARGRKAA